MVFRLTGGDSGNQTVEVPDAYVVITFITDGEYAGRGFRGVVRSGKDKLASEAWNHILVINEKSRGSLLSWIAISIFLTSLVLTLVAAVVFKDRFATQN